MSKSLAVERSSELVHHVHQLLAILTKPLEYVLQIYIYLYIYVCV